MPRFWAPGIQQFPTNDVANHLSQPIRSTSPGGATDNSPGEAAQRRTPGKDSKHSIQAPEGRSNRPQTLRVFDGTDPSRSQGQSRDPQLLFEQPDAPKTYLSLEARFAKREIKWPCTTQHARFSRLQESGLSKTSGPVCRRRRLGAESLVAPNYVGHPLKVRCGK